MSGARLRPLRATLSAVLCTFLLLSTTLARAQGDVSIRYESGDQLELARRIASELASEGYTVEVSTTSEPSPCDPQRSKLVSVPRGTKTWIRLAADPANADTIVASICYLGAQPFLQQAAPSAPRAEGQKLAVATAEALNGLRSLLPPIEGGSEPAAPPEVTAPPRESGPTVTGAPGFVNSVVLAATIVWNLPDFPAAPGVSGRGTLGITRSMSFAIDAFVPVAGRELSSQEMVAHVRTAWVRVGPRFHAAAGDFELSAAALAGPSVTWATAEALTPRVGTADVTAGAVLTLGAFVEYPRSAAVFACASASASALLPGVRVNLGDTAPPRGAFPLETSVGFGARWE